MNSFKKLLSFVAILALGFAIVRCGEDEVVPPSPPTVTSDVASLALTFGGTQSFNVAISAAGNFKEVKAATDQGTVTVTDIVGVGTPTATAKVNYTAPTVVATGKIVITVTDDSNQTATKEVGVTITEEAPLEVAAKTITTDETWGPYRTINVTGDITVAEGASLTIAEGTTVIINSEGVGFVIAGDFYSMGSAAHPNKFTIPNDQRKKENIFYGWWGGVLGTETSEEMVVLYTTFEFAGAGAKANTPIVTSGELEEGDPRFSLYFNNPDGKFIMQNSTVAYTKDDGMRVNQGQLLITNNTYILTGETGGDALNIKSGSTGDVAYNVFISGATNGVKWSNSDDREPQMDVNVYNNTAINCGWRQTKAGRGGSFNLEKGGRGKAYNNMVVNCKYGTRFPNAPDNPDLENAVTGYNFYYGNNETSVAGFYPSTGSITADSPMAAHDVKGAVGVNDPKFVKWDVVTTFTEATATSTTPDFLPADFDVHLQVSSPALSKGFTAFQTKYVDHTVGGVKYTVPAPSTTIGAKSTGTN